MTPTGCSRTIMPCSRCIMCPSIDRSLFSFFFFFFLRKKKERGGRVTDWGRLGFWDSLRDAAIQDVTVLIWVSDDVGVGRDYYIDFIMETKTKTKTKTKICNRIIFPIFPDSHASVWRCLHFSFITLLPFHLPLSFFLTLAPPYTSLFHILHESRSGGPGAT